MDNFQFTLLVIQNFVWGMVGRAFVMCDSQLSQFRCYIVGVLSVAAATLLYVSMLDASSYFSFFLFSFWRHGVEYLDLHISDYNSYTGTQNSAQPYLL